MSHVHAECTRCSLVSVAQNPRVMVCSMTLPPPHHSKLEAFYDRDPPIVSEAHPLKTYVPPPEPSNRAKLKVQSDQQCHWVSLHREKAKNPNVLAVALGNFVSHKYIGQAVLALPAHVATPLGRDILPQKPDLHAKTVQQMYYQLNIKEHRTKGFPHKDLCPSHSMECFPSRGSGLPSS